MMRYVDVKYSKKPVGCVPNAATYAPLSPLHSPISDGDRRYAALDDQHQPRDILGWPFHS